MIVIFKWCVPHNENENPLQIRKEFGEWKTVRNNEGI